MNDFKRFEAVGIEAALQAGKLLMNKLRSGFKIAHKGDTDLVTEADLAAERLIVSHIKEAFPDHAILAEENHSSTEPGAHTWIIDPLDGTTNYAHGYPAFAVSIGLEIEGELEWGVVYNPNLEERFTARRGAGAFVNGTRLRVSKTATMGASLLVTGFPYDIRTNPDNNLDFFAGFMLRSQAVRRIGSAALDFCYVAAGRFDGFWELDLRPWDMAAGVLIAREAGAEVTDFSGAPLSIYQPRCVASNGLIHQEMLTILEEVASLTAGQRRTT
jgi:myo-inositol-1(or 4)-monophosphatase